MFGSKSQEAMKQVIVVNMSLNLPKGKLAAQVAHASVASILRTDSKIFNKWLDVGMPKVVLKAENEDELHILLEKAELAKVPASLIRDAGKTVLKPGTITCLGIGPANELDIDAITGELKLL